MNCDIYQAEIEDLTDAQTLSSSGLEGHLKQCVDCSSFSAERARLRQLIGTLSPAAAPPDFNFRLKSRLRQTEQHSHHAASSLSSRQKTVWLSAVSAFCLLVFSTFILTRIFFVAIQPEAVVSESSTTSPTSNAAINAVPIPSNTVPTASQPQQNERVRELAKQHFPIIIKRETLPTERLKPKKVAAKDDAGIVSRDSPNGVKDSALINAPPSLMPRGIPNPLESPKKQAGRDLLRTFGIETITEGNGLRVISIGINGQAKSSGLQTGDIIQKVNGENPAAVSGSGFSDIKLIVRRSEKLQELRISLKP